MRRRRKKLPVNLHLYWIIIDETTSDVRATTQNLDLDGIWSSKKKIVCDVMRRSAETEGSWQQTDGAASAKGAQDDNDCVLSSQASKSCKISTYSSCRHLKLETDKKLWRHLNFEKERRCVRCDYLIGKTKNSYRYIYTVSLMIDERWDGIVMHTTTQNLESRITDGEAMAPLQQGACKTTIVVFWALRHWSIAKYLLMFMHAQANAKTALQRQHYFIIKL